MLTESLQSFDHSALHRDFQWDLANGSDTIRNNAHLIDDKMLRELVNTFGKNFEKVAPCRCCRA